MILSQNQPTLKIKYAVNTTGCNKDWDFKELAKNFRDTIGTINDVINHVKKGHALCAGNLGGKWRAKSNVVGSQWVLLDIDNSGKDANGEKCYEHQLTLDEALEHPFIQRYCALIYTTASHKPDWHKFRLVFLLPEFVPGYEIVEVLTRYLMKHLPHDPACKDASRVFYGSTEASFPLVQPNVTLPYDWISEAIAVTEREKLEYQKRIAEIEKRKAELRNRAESEGWDTDALIQQALNYIPPRQIGSGNYDESIKVLMALNDYYGAAEGQAIAERWSPSIKGTTWNVGAKFRSFRGRCGISIGTLFHVAKQYGFKFPVREKKFKRERSNEQRDVEIVEATSARLDKFRKKISNALINPIRHITPRVKRYVKKPKVINYVPGQLPTPEEWEKQGKPKIQFENASERKQLLQEATSKGWKHTLDNSHPGLGKSYSAGELTPCDLGVDKLIYQDINHRNASTITVEDNFVDIPVRNNGYKIDTTRSTPSGQHYRVRTKPGELPDTEGNCHRTYLFDEFRSKNYSDTFDFEESTVSPICEGCPLENQCRFSSGNGYGFRFQKRTVIENSTKLRSHPDTSPVKIFKSNTDEGKKESYRIARVWEEAGVSIKGVDSVEVTLKDFDHTVSEVALKTPETFEVLKPLFEVLRKLLNKEIKPKSKYGLSNKELVELIKERYVQDGKDLIGELVELKTDGGLRALQAILRPSLEFLAEKDGIDFNSKEAKDFKSLRWVNRELEKSSAREAGRKFLDLPLFWLVDFIKALIGKGSIRYERGKLSIYKSNSKHCDLASNAEFNLYLDATLTPEILRFKLGIEEPILVVQQAPPEYTNLKIVQVAGLGKLGKQRSDSLTKRVEALKSQLKNNHPDLKVLEWKALSGDGEFNHFADGRGVNRFEGTSALASFGIPYQNIGELAAHYQVLSEAQIALNNPNDDFQLCVEQLTQAEIVQEIGRLRANRRPDEELTFYFCADYDLSFLAEHFSSATLIKVDAFAITPDAGTENQQNKLAILEAAKELVNRGAKLTQQAIANTAEITQGTVSKIASQFGGWSPLKKLFQSLLDSLYSVGNNFNGAKNVDKERDCIPELAAYLPTLASAEVSTLEAVEAMVDVLEVIGETVFRQSLKYLDVAVRGKLLGKILPIDCVEAQIILELSPK